MFVCMCVCVRKCLQSWQIPRRARALVRRDLDECAAGDTASYLLHAITVKYARSPSASQQCAN